MNTASDQAAPGGFLSATLPSPPPSSHASTLPGRNILPTTRSSPLKPGSTKESTFIDYVDNKLLRISRRYEKRFNADLGDEDPDKGDIEGRGYKSFGEMVKDLEAVIDVVWTSGSRRMTQKRKLMKLKQNISFSADTLSTQYCSDCLHVSPSLRLCSPSDISAPKQARSCS